MSDDNCKDILSSKKAVKDELAKTRKLLESYALFSRKTINEAMAVLEVDIWFQYWRKRKEDQKNYRELKDEKGGDD